MAVIVKRNDGSTLEFSNYSFNSMVKYCEGTWGNTLKSSDLLEILSSQKLIFHVEEPFSSHEKALHWGTKKYWICLQEPTFNDPNHLQWIAPVCADPVTGMCFTYSRPPLEDRYESSTDFTSSFPCDDYIPMEYKIPSGEKTAHSMYGWICPLCFHSNNPREKECFHCNKTTGRKEEYR